MMSSLSGSSKALKGSALRLTSMLYCQPSAVVVGTVKCQAVRRALKVLPGPWASIHLVCRLCASYTVSMLKTPCPVCGGQQTVAVGPGRYRCSSGVEYFEDVLIDDPMARLVYGSPGPKYERVRRVRTCGHEFVVQTQHGQQICTGTLDGSACGSYAAGVCQGEGCGQAVCSRHGTYVAERLLCARCTRDAHAARVARNVERARERSRANTERSAALAGAACDELAEATDPAQILNALRRFTRDRGLQRETGPWTDPAHVESFMRLVVPAWQRYLASRRPHHPHEIARFMNYKVGRRPDNVSRVLTRVPCWVSLHHKQEIISHGDKIQVDDAWAFTADMAYHIGNDHGSEEWSRWGDGPILSGDFMVCTGVLPQSVVVHGYRRLYHCFAVSSSRPLSGKDVLDLLVLGHQSPTNHLPNSLTAVQFE